MNVYLYNLDSKNHLEVDIHNNFKILRKNISYPEIVLKNTGRCDFINNKWIAIYSLDKFNYLFLQNRDLKITADISINHYCGKSKSEKSWFKIYFGEIIIFEDEFINSHGPIYGDEDFFPDWQTMNIANIIYESINQIKSDPNIILFPNKQNI